jgi:hypothetical protein
VAQEVGVRNWWTMKQMMPQPRSFLLPPHDSLCWSWLDWQAERLGKFVHEHAMFAGVVAWACAAAALLGLRRLDPERRRLARAAAIAVAAVCVLVMYAFDFSLYRAVAALPLANAVRAVSRVILVLLFPFAVAAAGTFTQLELWGADPTRRLRLARLAPIALFAALVIDNAVTDAAFERHPKAAWQERTRRLADRVRSAGDAKVFVHVSHAEDSYRIPAWCVDQIDAILASQDTGVPTINAYSGNWPAGWERPMRSWELIGQWVEKARENARDGKTRPGDPDRLFDGLVVIGEPTGERPASLAGVRVVPLAAGR